jgi:hypothetical protein
LQRSVGKIQWKRQLENEKLSEKNLEKEQISDANLIHKHIFAIRSQDDTQLDPLHPYHDREAGKE